MRDFWKSVGRRGPMNTQGRANVSIREMNYWHPNSVYASLVGHADWISKLQISAQAKRLTRLRGPDFKVAVQQILTCDGFHAQLTANRSRIVKELGLPSIHIRR